MTRRWAPFVALAAACAPSRPAPAPAPAPIPAVSDTARTPTVALLPATGGTNPTPVPAAPHDSEGTTPEHLPVTPAHRRSNAPGHLTLTFTGDINLGTTFLPDGVPPDSGRGLLVAVDSLLRGDLVIGNFEGTLSDTLPAAKCGPRARNCYTFRTPPYLAARLKEAGFTHLNLANNHALDLGLAGREETIRHLDSLGLRHYGPIGEITFDSLLVGDSLRVVALVGFATSPAAYNLLDLRRSATVVDSVRKLADVVIVTFHGGTEGDRAVRTGTRMEHLGREPRGDLRRWAHAVVEAGADVVVGHGPHVLRGIEFWRGRPIFYSLGNFLTWRGFSLTGYKGITAILTLELDPAGRFLGARIVPLRQVPRLGPVPDPRRTALNLIRRVSALDFPATGAVMTADGVVAPPPPARRTRRRASTRAKPPTGLP